MNRPRIFPPRRDPRDPREAFLRQVAAQLPGWDTRFLVTRELRAHLEDQTQALEGEMDPRQAAVRAVEGMGDPEELGRQLAWVHRPRTPWLLLALAAAALALGLGIQLLLSGAGRPWGEWAKGAAGWVLSLAVLAGACRWGAFLVRQFPLLLPGAAALLGAASLLWQGPAVNGMGWWALSFGQYLCPFLPAAFALGVTRLEGKGLRGVLLCGGAWLLCAAYCLLLPRTGWALAVTLADLAILTAACGEGWFGPGRPLQLGMIWVPAGAGGLWLLSQLLPRMDRLAQGWAYQQNQGVWRQVLPWGAAAGTGAPIPGWRTEFLFTSLAARLGWVGAAAAAAALAAFLGLLLWRAGRLARPGDRFMARAAALTLAVQLALACLGCLGGPVLEVWFPFWDPGLRAGLATAALTGLCLSFFREEKGPLARLAPVPPLEG